MVPRTVENPEPKAHMQEIVDKRQPAPCGHWLDLMITVCKKSCEAALEGGAGAPAAKSLLHATVPH